MKRKKHVKITVYVLSSTPLKWFEDMGLLGALGCFFSTSEDVRSVLLAVAPCPGEGEELKAPRRWRWVAEKMRRCDYEACSTLDGKPYPDNPGYERCMVLRGDDGCRIVYVRDWGRRRA